MKVLMVFYLHEVFFYRVLIVSKRRNVNSNDEHGTNMSVTNTLLRRSIKIHVTVIGWKCVLSTSLKTKLKKSVFFKNLLTYR